MKNKIRWIKLLSGKNDNYGAMVGPSFIVGTDAGAVGFTFRTKLIEYKLKKHLPHIFDELIEKKPQTQQEFDRILLGKFIFGEIR